MPVQHDPLPLDSPWRWFRWRALALVLVFGMALTALLLGVGVSDRDYVPAAGLLTKVYYALGLFVFGGLDFGTPRGGPEAARIALWVAYFLAPAITTSALVEAVLRVIKPRAWRIRWLRDHRVVVGCGRLGRLYLRSLRQRDGRQRLLVVDRRVGSSSIEVAASRYRAELLIGDITSAAVLESLRLGHAREVALLTGDDFVNLDTAARAIRAAPHLTGKVVAHVADLRLLHVIREAGLLQGIQVFNSHQTAASHLVEGKLLPRFHVTALSDNVVLAGFGRFGQTVLDELQRRAAGNFARVILLDLAARRRAGVFAEQVGFGDSYSHDVVEGDMQDPASWQQVEQRIDCAGDQLVAVLGCNDPGLNIRTALWLRSRFPRAYIVARCFYRSTFTDEISQQGSFEIVSTADLLLQRLGREAEPRLTNRRRPPREA